MKLNGRTIRAQNPKIWNNPRGGAGLVFPLCRFDSLAQRIQKQTPLLEMTTDCPWGVYDAQLSRALRPQRRKAAAKCYDTPVQMQREPCKPWPSICPSLDNTSIVPGVIESNFKPKGKEHMLSFQPMEVAGLQIAPKKTARESSPCCTKLHCINYNCVGEGVMGNMYVEPYTSKNGCDIRAP